VVASWRFRRRCGGALVRTPRRTRLVGACDNGTCRDDPIPPGVYWLDVIWEEASDGVPKPQHFALWIGAMRATGWVKLLQSVHHEGTFKLPDFDPMVDEPARDWVLFQVLRPAPRWTPVTGLGLPTVAPQGIETTEDDTIQSPPSESILDRLLPESALGRAAVVAASIAAIGLVAYGVTRR